MITMADNIKAALLAAFMPSFFNIEDESQFHHKGEQTHYKVVLVSDAFEGLPAVKRHQLVYSALGDLMQQFHALVLHTYSPNEWRSNTLDTIAASPVCHGGGLHDLQAN